MSQQLYTLAIAVLVIERFVELRLSKYNAKWALAQGGLEYGQGHFLWMKLLHTALFVGCLAEVWFLHRVFVPVLGWSMLLAIALAQGLRYWAIGTLGRRWNVRVIVVPGAGAEVGGPFRLMRHPNYVAVVVEGLAIPLLHSAIITAVVFSVLNSWLLSVRIACEERALTEHCSYSNRLGGTPRFVPALLKRW